MTWGSWALLVSSKVKFIMTGFAISLHNITVLLYAIMIWA